MQSHRRHTMWLGAYAHSHAALFVSAGALEVLLASIMDATEMNQDMTTLICLVVAVAFLIGFLADYARHRSFYRSLDEVIATGEAPPCCSRIFLRLLHTLKVG